MFQIEFSGCSDLSDSHITFSYLFVPHRYVMIIAPLVSLCTSSEPPILIEVDGTKHMKILGVIISLPPPDSEVYKEYLKCNNFCLFRRSCTAALKEFDIDPK